MRTSAGASTPSRTWLPRTSRTRTVTASPTRITSPNFLVRTSIARICRLDARPALGEQLPQHLAQEPPRDLVHVGAVAALRDRGTEARHLLLPQGVERARPVLCRLLDPHRSSPGRRPAGSSPVYRHDRPES